jgi:hypothetical protein
MVCYLVSETLLQLVEYEFYHVLQMLMRHSL